MPFLSVTTSVGGGVDETAAGVTGSRPCSGTSIGGMLGLAVNMPKRPPEIASDWTGTAHGAAEVESARASSARRASSAPTARIVATVRGGACRRRAAILARADARTLCIRARKGPQVIADRGPVELQRRSWPPPPLAARDPVVRPRLPRRLGISSAASLGALSLLHALYFPRCGGYSFAQPGRSVHTADALLAQRARRATLRDLGSACETSGRHVLTLAKCREWRAGRRNGGARTPHLAQCGPLTLRRADPRGRGVAKQASSVESAFNCSIFFAASRASARAGHPARSHGRRTAGRREATSSTMICSASPARRCRAPRARALRPRRRPPRPACGIRTRRAALSLLVDLACALSEASLCAILCSPAGHRSAHSAPRRLGGQ